MLTRHLFILFFVAISVQCNEAKEPGKEDLQHLTFFGLDEVTDIKLIQDRSFRGSQNAEVTKIGDAAADASGNVYFVDEFKNKIHVVDSSGTPIGTMGRSGGRPGEFYKLGDIDIVNGKVYAFDEERKAMNVYGTNGFNFQTSIVFTSSKLRPDSLASLAPYSATILPDGLYLAGFQKVNSPTDRQLFFYRTDELAENYSGEIISYPNRQLFAENGPNGFLIMMMPYEPETILSHDTFGNLYTIFTEDFIIKKHDQNGNYLEAWQYPLRKKKLLKADAIDMYTETDIRRAIRGDDTPDTWPAVAHYLIDDNDQHWVATITHNLENYTWFVLGNSGEVLGKSVLSRDIRIKAINKSHFYAVKFNKQTYTEELLRFSIQF
jgi:hypothetical protein